MPYNGSGVFQPLNPPTFPAVAGTLIESDKFNAIIRDLNTGLTTALARDGQAAPFANIPMGGFKFTNVGDATAPDQFATYGQLLAAGGGGGGGGSGSAMPTVTDAPFNAVGDGTTPDQDAFTDAAAAFQQLRVPPGVYRFSANTTISAAMMMDNGAVLAPDAGVTIMIGGPFLAGRSLHFSGAGLVTFAPGTVDSVCAEWLGLSTTNTAAANNAALLKAWVTAYGTGLTVGRGAFALGDVELKVYALSNTSQLPNFFRGSGVDGNGGGGGVSANVGTTFFGPSARIHWNNDAVGNSDARIIVEGFHVVGANDNTAGVGGLKFTKVSNFVVQHTQVTGSRGSGYEIVKCYGSSFEYNTALSNRHHGFLCNQQFNQGFLGKNKAIGNGKDYSSIWGGIAFAGGVGLESLSPIVVGNDISYSGLFGVLYKTTNPSPTANSITLTNVITGGGLAIATTAVAHGRTTGEYITLFGCVSDPRLNTVSIPQITVLNATQFRWTLVIQPGQTALPVDGTFNDGTMVIGPAACGAIYNSMRGFKITHYAEDCIGPAMYMGANVSAGQLSGGYNQGVNNTSGGNGVMLVDGASDVEIGALHLSGANSALIIAVPAVKHGINVKHTVTVANGARIAHSSLQMRDGQYAAAAPPVAGVWLQGIDTVKNLFAAPGQPQAWYCSAAPATFTAVDAASGGGGGGGVTLPPDAGHANEFLRTNGAGTLSWAAPSGGSGGAGSFASLVVSGNATVNNQIIAGGTISVAPSAGFAINATAAVGTTGIRVATQGSGTGIVIDATSGGLGLNVLGTAQFSSSVSVGGNISSSATGIFQAISVGAGGSVVTGASSYSGGLYITKPSGTALEAVTPASGTGLRLTTAGSGTALVVDASSGGTGLYVIGNMRLDLTAATGVGVASTTFLSAKPGGSTNGIWLAMNANGVPGRIAFWPD